MKRTYLDWAAAAPVTKAAERAYTRALRAYGNPSAAHTEGRAGKAIVEDARRTIAAFAGAKPEAVIFTAGATEANAIAIRGFVKARLREGSRATDLHLLYGAGAHASVDGAMRALNAEGIATDAIPFKDGDIDLAALRALIRPETALVTVEAVSSETGARIDTRAVRRMLDEARSADAPRIILHVDATQVPLVESFERTRLGGDLISLDAQKVGGVRGIGCLITPPGVSLAAVMEGGGQERGLRSGTESPAHAAAFAAALNECALEREKFSERALRAREVFVASIQSAISDAVVNEGRKNVQHIVNFSFPDRDTDFLAALLDERGFAVSTKSACETDSEAGSRAVLAQTGDARRASATLRISWGPTTRDGELKRVGKALIEAVRFQDTHTL